MFMHIVHVTISASNSPQAAFYTDVSRIMEAVIQTLMGTETK